MRLYKLSQEEHQEAFLGAFQDFVYAYEDAEQRIYKSLTYFVNASQYSDVSLPDDIMFRLFAMDTESVKSAYGSAQYGDTSEATEMFNTLSHSINNGPLANSLQSFNIKTSRLSPFTGGDVESYTLYIRSASAAVKAITEALESLQREVESSKDVKSADSIVSNLASQHALNTGTSREHATITPGFDEAAPEPPEPGVRQPTEEEREVQEKSERVEPGLRLDTEQSTYATIDSLRDLEDMIDLVEGVAGKISKEDAQAFADSILRFAESIKLDVSTIKQSVSIEGGETKGKIGKLVVSLAANELLLLKEDGNLSSARLAAASSLKQYNEPSVALDILKKNYGDILNKPYAIDFTSIFNVLEKMAMNKEVTPSDMSTVQNSAQKTSEIKPKPDDFDSIPISNERYISEMKSIIEREASKVSEFIFWKAFNNMPSILQKSDRAFSLLSGSPRAGVPSFSADQSASITIGENPVFINPTKFNFHSETESSSVRKDFRNRIFSRMSGILEGISEDVRLAPPEVKSSKMPSEYYLSDDSLSGAPTTIDSNRILSLGKELYDVCSNVPEWREGGAKAEEASSIREKIDAMFANYVYHSNVGINVGGKQYVSTLYDLVMSSLITAINDAAKSKDETKFTNAKSSLLSLLASTCPWAKDLSVIDGIDSEHIDSLQPALSSANALPGDVTTYSCRTAEQVAIISKSIVYIVKSYCNMAGIVSAPSYSEKFLRSLTIDGKNIISIFINTIVNKLTAQVKSNGKKMPNTAALRKFNRASDKSEFLFGTPADDFVNVIISTVGYNISDLFSRQEEESGVPALASNTNQYRNAIGILTYGISSNTNMLGAGAFDISSVLANYRGNRNIADIYGEHTRRLFGNIKQVIDTASYSSGVEASNIKSTPRESTIMLDDKMVPSIMSGSTFSLLDENGVEIASSSSDRKPTMKLVDGKVHITFRPGFGDVNISNARQIKIDYTGATPDSSGYGLQKIYTGNHLTYAKDMEDKFNDFLKSISDVVSSGKTGGFINVEELFKSVQKLKQFQKSIWNTIAILPSLEQLDKYGKTTGEIGGYLQSETKIVRDTLKKMTSEISSFIEQNKKYLPK